jgi:hypothetical protein
MTTRVAAHIAAKATMVINGRSYTTTVGGTADVPDYDAAELESNGWLAMGMVGTTAQRPTGPAKGQEYIDTTLTAVVAWDGVANWRNKITGALV